VDQLPKPKWKIALEEKIAKANKMAEEFKAQGIDCYVDKAGDICTTGKAFENYKSRETKD
jgi:hypothetical protein